MNARQDLVATLHRILEGFCDFCTTLHSAIDWGSGYDRSDAISVLTLGDEDDVTGFWPEIR